MEEILHELKHFLPAQAPLKDFVHHNTLHAFQHMPFFQALKQANTQMGYRGYLTLDAYRTLYRDGKIKGSSLKYVAEEHFGASEANHWVIKLLDQSYEEIQNPKVGSFRAHWKSDYHFNFG